MAGAPQVEGLKAAPDLAKQIIALATGAVAFTVTFLKEFTRSTEGEALAVPPGLYAAWVMFGLAILFATWNLMAITGSLDAIDRKANGWEMTEQQKLSADGDAGNALFPAQAMVVTFLFAVVAMIWVGFSL